MGSRISRWIRTILSIAAIASILAAISVAPLIPWSDLNLSLSGKQSTPPTATERQRASDLALRVQREHFDSLRSDLGENDQITIGPMEFPDDQYQMPFGVSAFSDDKGGALAIVVVFRNSHPGNLKILREMAERKAESADGRYPANVIGVYVIAMLKPKQSAE